MQMSTAGSTICRRQDQRICSRLASCVGVCSHGFGTKFKFRLLTSACVKRWCWIARLRSLTVKQRNGCGRPSNCGAMAREKRTVREEARLPHRPLRSNLQTCCTRGAASNEQKTFMTSKIRARRVCSMNTQLVIVRSRSSNNGWCRHSGGRPRRLQRQSRQRQGRRQSHWSHQPHSLAMSRCHEPAQRRVSPTHSPSPPLNRQEAALLELMVAPEGPRYLDPKLWFLCCGSGSCTIRWTTFGELEQAV